ncbi:hypothetical protein Dda_2879 [Drechslerella dactyloides]|uniref:Uncharacterized protein n=1 Tax=Drechslerella dactyloides TaxID=74499 RepID=A0AAD6NL93_DREDA|nr:hypothetical protein Dda_2879 [Drechslerella dactyloides]
MSQKAAEASSISRGWRHGRRWSWNEKPQPWRSGRVRCDQRKRTVHSGGRVIESAPCATDRLFRAIAVRRALISRRPTADVGYRITGAAGDAGGKEKKSIADRTGFRKTARRAPHIRSTSASEDETAAEAHTPAAVLGSLGLDTGRRLGCLERYSWKRTAEQASARAL